MNWKDPRYVAVAASSALVVVVGVLAVQNFRHGWPFSLHHGIAVSPAAVAVTERGSTAPSQSRAEVALEQAQIEAIGVRIDTVRLETISQSIRTVATVIPDESRLSHVHTRVSGWIERLNVNTTGEQVRAGQPLAGIFSQELMSSQAEYVAARRAATTGPRSATVEGARARLGVLGMTAAEIREIEESGEPRRLVTVTAPRSGIVLNRGISVGTAVDPSTEIMTIADLSQVWVLAEIPEAEVSGVQVGTPAEIDFTASGRGSLQAAVAFIYPTLSERTRTLRVRFTVDNPEGALRPGMYGTASFQVAPRSALTVPRDAIVDTGDAQYVYVVAGEGRFSPRPVKLGARFDQRVEVREGLADGEPIVASGVFLIDSESRLRASGGGTGPGHAGMNMGQDGSDAGEDAKPSPTLKLESRPPSAEGADHRDHGANPPPPR